MAPIKAYSTSSLVSSFYVVITSLHFRTLSLVISASWRRQCLLAYSLLRLSITRKNLRLFFALFSPVSLFVSSAAATTTATAMNADMRSEVSQTIFCSWLGIMIFPTQRKQCGPDCRPRGLERPSKHDRLFDVCHPSSRHCILPCLSQFESLKLEENDLVLEMPYPISFRED